MVDPRTPTATTTPHDMVRDWTVPRDMSLARGWCLVAALALALCLAGSAIASPLPQRLRDTGLYADSALSRVAPDVLPYTPQYPLWSDGATKRRWIRLPRGTSIDGRDPDAWVFPVGARIWKQFGSEERRRETRLIVRASSGWVYGTYRWTEDGSDAVLVADQGAVDEDPSWPGGRYVFPSQQDCRSCHEGRPTPVLGFSALQLSPDRDPDATHGETPVAGGLDLAVLVDRHLIRGLPPGWRTKPPRIGATTPSERSALGYLHGNCGQCHNARGPLATLGLDLWVDPARPDGATREVLASLLGRSSFRIPGQTPAHAARMSPGAPDRSAILVRMRTRDPTTQMPPLATRVVDGEAVRRVQQWIAQLSPPPAP
jgi:hypothetical protein